ncbi:MAG: NBR1-Ig-like domain-containing protein [Anaerolineales bacterium]|nr:NBR1-Ig-like domain-containing protein [Anaerolineales bacterium]
MKNNIKSISLWITLMIFLFLVGCKSAEPTITADQVLTSVAETVDASLATMQESTATLTETPLPSETPTITATPSPSPTQDGNLGQPTQTTNPGTSGGCDSATFASDVTIPDGTQIGQGTVFVKTWQVQNSGTCTWTAEYAVVFSSGDQMEGETPQSLAIAAVEPGKMVEISVEMTAPDSLGEYIGYWRMANASATAFGDAFYVEIEVIEATTNPTPTNTLVLTATSTSTPEPTEVPTETPTPTP